MGLAGVKHYYDNIYHYLICKNPFNNRENESYWNRIGILTEGIQ